MYNCVVLLLAELFGPVFRYLANDDLEIIEIFLTLVNEEVSNGG